MKVVCGGLADVPPRLICVVPDTLLGRPCLLANPSVWRLFSFWARVPEELCHDKLCK